ncbi:MAG: molybdenum cofactor guanylyltransferase [Lachnospiraceae bacterium]|nr:molybdenum cofactor guanylyltransferase [Lachnospiraceae bacterium]
MRDYKIAAAVLIGGRSERMGSPKEDIVIPGESRTFLEHICDEVDACYDEVIFRRYLSVRKDQERYRNGWISITDEYDDIGPMGGLIAALKKAGDDGADALLLLACDMIKYNREEIRHVCSSYRGQDLFFVRTKDARIQPLAGIYETGILDYVRGLASNGEYRLRKLTECNLDTGYCDALSEASYANINTPQDMSV